MTRWSDVNAGLVVLWSHYWDARLAGEDADAAWLRAAILDATRALRSHHAP